MNRSLIGSLMMGLSMAFTASFALHYIRTQTYQWHLVAVALVLLATGYVMWFTNAEAERTEGLEDV